MPTTTLPKLGDRRKLSSCTAWADTLPDRIISKFNDGNVFTNLKPLDINDKFELHELEPFLKILNTKNESIVYTYNYTAKLSDKGNFLSCTAWY